MVIIVREVEWDLSIYFLYEFIKSYDAYLIGSVG